MKLSQMKNLGSSWNLDGAESPNSDALAKAERWLSQFAPVQPVSVLPSVEGGILLRFVSGSFEAFIECYNDGDVGYSLVSFNKVIKTKDLGRSSDDVLEATADIKSHLGIIEENHFAKSV